MLSSRNPKRFRHARLALTLGLAPFLASFLMVSEMGLDAKAAPETEPAERVEEAADDPAVLARAAVQEDVLRMIGGTGGPSAEWGVLAVSLERGDTLAALGADLPLTPASNQKLFTSAAALHRLGPDYRFPTYLLARGSIRNGVLDGSLILYGTGDPAISRRLLDAPEAPFREFAQALKEQGVYVVTGDVIGDPSFFAASPRPPSWGRGYVDNWYAAPASALSFSDNVMTLRISPAAPGSPPRVRTTPETSGQPLANVAGTVTGSPRRPLAVIREDPAGTIEIRGDIRVGSADVWREITVSDPAVLAASVLRRVLEEEGIRVEGRARSLPPEERSQVSGAGIVAPALTAEVPPLRTIAVHHSPPLSEILGVVNRVSHNLWAELILLALGRADSGLGSFDAGSRALTDYLVNVVGIPSADIRVADGSGLSRRNRATASSFVRLLSHVAGTPHADAFWAALPVAGDRRELGRMYGSAAAGNLRAKTGTIRRVSALSGVVHTVDGEPVVFSIVSNGVASSWAAKRMEDQIGVRLATVTRPWMPDAPELARVEPGTHGPRLAASPLEVSADPVGAAR